MNAERTLQRLLKLRVAAYACHESARGHIEKTIQSSDILSVCRLHFYAYFCEAPVVWRAGGKRPDPVLYALFIDREIARRNLSLHLPVDASRVTKAQFLRNFKQQIVASLAGPPPHIKLAYTDGGNSLREWYRYSRLGPISAGTLGHQLFEDWWGPERKRNATRLDPLQRAGCLEDIRQKIDNDNLSLDEQLAYVNLFVLLYHGLVASDNPDDCLFFSAAPICTTRTFHGLLMAVIEAPGGSKLAADREAEVNEARESVEQNLLAQAEHTYLPTLILFQNSCEEHTLDQHLDPKKYKKPVDAHASLQTFKNSRAGRVYSLLPNATLPLGTGRISHNELLESHLAELWRRRFTSLNSVAGRKEIKNSLVFNEMMIASPGLIETVCSVAELRLSCPQKPPLPAVLIVAPPGAGKESLSKLIPIFSDYFWNKPRVAFNMGSIMLDAEGHKDGFRGILAKLARKRLKKGGVIVLDELNSLNISAQPMLLRILEQGEIALSSSDGNKPLPWLFIGLINEEPARLTLEALRDRFIDDPVFGELLGTALYEHWKVKSRLRDDLYYRIRRCGEIRLNGLNERRPDIPIVFYFKLGQFLKELPGNKLTEIFVTYDALQELTSDKFDWSGNMRKLENVARHTKSRVTLRKSIPLNVTPGTDVDVIQVEAQDIRHAFVETSMKKGRRADLLKERAG